MDNRTGSALSTNERPSRKAKFMLIGLSAIFGMTPKARPSQVTLMEEAEGGGGKGGPKSPPKFGGQIGQSSLSLVIVSRGLMQAPVRASCVRGIDLSIPHSPNSVQVEAPDEI